MIALRGAADAVEQVDAGARAGRRDRAGHVAVGDEVDAGAGAADVLDQLGVPRPVEHADRDVGDVDALRLRHPADVLGDGRGDVDDVGRLRARRRASPCRTRPTGRTWRRARRPRAPRPSRACPWPSAWCRRSGRRRRRTTAPSPLPTSSPLNSIGRLVLLALADHDDAAHRHGADELAHRVDRRAVAAVLVAAADPAPGGHRGRFGDADQLHREVAVRRLAAPLRVGRSSRPPSSSRSPRRHAMPRGVPGEASILASTGESAERWDDGGCEHVPPDHPARETARSALSVRDMAGCGRRARRAGAARGSAAGAAACTVRAGWPAGRPDGGAHGRRAVRSGSAGQGGAVPGAGAGGARRLAGQLVGIDPVGDGSAARVVRVGYLTHEPPVPAADAGRRHRGADAAGRRPARRPSVATGPVDVGGTRWVVYGGQAAPSRSGSPTPPACAADHGQRGRGEFRTLAAAAVTGR